MAYIQVKKRYHLEKTYKYELINKIWKKVKKITYDQVYLEDLKGNAAYAIVPSSWVKYRDLPFLEEERINPRIKFLTYLYSEFARPKSHVYIKAVNYEEDIFDLSDFSKKMKEDLFCWSIFVITLDYDFKLYIVRDKNNFNNFRITDLITNKNFFITDYDHLNNILKKIHHLNEYEKVIYMRLFTEVDRL